MARNTKIHAFWSFFRCSWCISVLKTIHLGTFVGGNPLYILWRSFPESFTKNAFLFSTLPVVSTWPAESLMSLHCGTMLSPPAKSKIKMQFFWNFHEMIYRVCTVDYHPKTFVHASCSTQTYTTNIETNYHPNMSLRFVVVCWSAVHYESGSTWPETNPSRT